MPCCVVTCFFKHGRGQHQYFDFQMSRCLHSKEKNASRAANSFRRHRSSFHMRSGTCATYCQVIYKMITWLSIQKMVIQTVPKDSCFQEWGSEVWKLIQWMTIIDIPICKRRLTILSWRQTALKTTQLLRPQWLTIALTWASLALKRTTLDLSVLAYRYIC